MKNISQSFRFGGVVLAALAGSVMISAAAGLPAGKPVMVKTEIALPGGIDFANWVSTDLSKYDPAVKVIMNLPKTAKISKPEYGGVEVILSEEYNLYIRPTFYETTALQKESLADATLYEVGKILKEDPNGLVYSEQIKQVEGFDPYGLESHFILLLGTGDKMYKITDQKALDNYVTPSSYYTAENALKLYDAVKATAKMK